MSNIQDYSEFPMTKWPNTKRQKTNGIKCEQILDLTDMNFKLTVVNNTQTYNMDNFTEELKSLFNQIEMLEKLLN